MGLELSMLAATTADGHWKPGIGDPTFMGWVTVLAYLSASVLCAIAARREGRLPSARSLFAVDPIFWMRGPDRPASPPARTTGPAFWWLLAILLLLLGVNKQLDLQSAITDIGRTMAKSQGWYNQRGIVQRRFILGVAFSGLVGLVAFGWCFRAAALRRPLAITGLVFLVGFVTIRAASFHHVDQFITSRFLGLKWNWILELSGIGLIASSAIAHIRSTPIPDKQERPPERGAVRYRIPGR